MEQSAILVTGGAGFIGSAFVRHMLRAWPEARVVVYDKLTYAGNVENLAPVSDDTRFRFVRGDVCAADEVRERWRLVRAGRPVAGGHAANCDRGIL